MLDAGTDGTKKWNYRNSFGGPERQGKTANISVLTGVMNLARVYVYKCLIFLLHAKFVPSLLLLIYNANWLV